MSENFRNSDTFGRSKNRSLFKSIDQFGEGLKMKLDGGVDTYSSRCGAFFSLVAAIVLIFYMLIKIDTIVSRNDVDIFSAILDHEITQEDKFDSTQGFYIAAGLTAYDGIQESIDDKKYGQLVFDYLRWGNEDDASG